MKDLLFIGLDVDDKAFHVHAIQQGEERFQFSCKPSIGVLDKKLKGLIPQGTETKIFYEATYVGFSLHRQLNKLGYENDVIAPSLVPIIPGEKVKTNRLDCKKLAEFGSKGELTKVHIPSEEEETVRDLVRARRFLTEQLRRQKQFLLSLCRRMGWNYRQALEKEKASYWTAPHLQWLEKQIAASNHSALKFSMARCLDGVKSLKEEIATFEAEIEKIALEPFYRRKVEALCCFRGVDTLTAMTLATEIGDIGRFVHPATLTSFAGMDICEYSSGKEKRWSITKMGNHHIRTAVVEAAQSAWRMPRVSKRLKAKRQGVDSKVIDVAERCMKRLNKKATHLHFRGKEKNKVTVACAREMLCFVWEALKMAA